MNKKASAYERRKAVQTAEDCGCAKSDILRIKNAKTTEEMRAALRTAIDRKEYL